eukprot:1156806-Pelagomonas_calceolata.AAC.4
MPKYAPCLHVKCAHPQPFDLIGTFFALKCSWRYKLPEHMVRFVEVALCAEIDWARSHLGHINLNYGEMAETATKHLPLGLYAPFFAMIFFCYKGPKSPKAKVVQWVVRYGALVVKTRVFAAAN